MYVMAAKWGRADRPLIYIFRNFELFDEAMNSNSENKMMQLAEFVLEPSNVDPDQSKFIKERFGFFREGFYMKTKMILEMLEIFEKHYDK